jgi:poly-gamma-glutamate synthesis protein (capsule biosynthesis protein)
VLLAGDVMTGRGVDQILRHPSEPGLHEPAVRDARTYVELAESQNGHIPRPVDDAYVWGDALGALERIGSEARIVNLETSITRSDAYWPGKGIHYRMHPDNVGCLTVARIDVCVLANNHVLDYGRAGLLETLQTLEKAGVKTAGAGRTLEEARRPATVGRPGGGRVVIIAFGAESSGIRPDWAATEGRPGVDLLPDLSDATADAIGKRVEQVKQPLDVAVASVHWGENWGYDVPPEHVRFARRLIDAGLDIVHGHSSHHPRPIEVYRHRLILYGCGDFIDDYEGIAGYEAYRDDLVLMYFASLTPAGELERLRMVPLQHRRLRLTHASAVDTEWLRDTLERVSGGFGTRVELEADGTLLVEPGAATDHPRPLRAVLSPSPTARKPAGAAPESRLDRPGPGAGSRSASRPADRMEGRTSRDAVQSGPPGTR